MRKYRSGARTQVRTLWRWALSSPTSYTVSVSVAASNTETSAVGRSTSLGNCVSRPSGTSATTSALIASLARARLALNAVTSCEVVEARIALVCRGMGKRNVCLQARGRSPAVNNHNQNKIGRKARRRPLWWGSYALKLAHVRKVKCATTHRFEKCASEEKPDMRYRTDPAIFDYSGYRHVAE